MKKALLPLIVIVLALAATAGGVLALTGDGDGEPTADGAPRSDEGIGPNECNLVHNINACDAEDLDRLGGDALQPAPSNDGDVGDVVVEPVSGQPPIRSDEGIDPDECNLVHNINACDEDDIARLGGDSQ